MVEAAPLLGWPRAALLSGACNYNSGVTNLYFELTREFNQLGPAAVLSSGQAVAYYRLAIMSKDGDWIVREADDACAHVRSVLSRYGARQRPSAPLDVRWLGGGWSSHFEFFDPRQRRIRCDFVSRPPRVPAEALTAMFRGSPASQALLVVERDVLIRLKQTARAKDYAVIGELARQLPPNEEILWTTDVDRILELSSLVDRGLSRPSVQAARSGAGRATVVAALALEVDALQQSDRGRLIRYQQAAETYLHEFRQLALDQLPLDQAHEAACRLAEASLPQRPMGNDTP